MAVVLSVLLFMAVATALFAFGAAAMAPGSVIGARLRTLTSKPPRSQTLHLEERLEQAVLDPLSRVVPKSPQGISRTRAQLMEAGFREGRHITIYFGARVLCALAGVAAATGLELSVHAPVLLIAVPLVGYFLPWIVLKQLIRRRQHDIRLALPDALDLAVICVEAGLGLDQTLQRVGGDLKYAHPELSEEFALVNLEMRAGKPRAESLRNLAARTGVDDVRALVAVLVQTDRFGTSVADALRVHSDALRTERRQRAEEAAAKTTIKMVPVLVFFIFPAMFVVTLGPAAIQLVQRLLPLVQR
jgi:tight adherence protein C